MSQPRVPARAPTVASTRPQFGSAPKSAAFTSGELAMERATSRADASDGAPVTTTSRSLVAPSPSEAMARVISRKRSVTAASSTSRSGPASAMRALPARPLASAMSVSFVDMSPSTVSISKVRFTARPSTSCSIFGVTETSVTSTQIMVASCGASIPEPLAMADTVAAFPPTTTSREAIFGLVSVVMMASAAKSARAPSCSTSAGSPSRIFWAGSRTPITPVEAVSTARFCTPSASARAPRRLATSSRPRGPVSALALPLFTSTARMPSEGTRSRASITGAAAALLMVKRPAAAAGTSETTSATSRRCGFKPTATPLKRKPLGIFTSSLRGDRARGSRPIPAWRSGPGRPGRPRP